MASRDEVTLPAARRPKSRKSIGGIPQSDQENMTADLGALRGKRTTAGEKPGKKSRSKSIGPGGLDALGDSSGNRRKSLASIPPLTPRSILKPTMPPLREIPAHSSMRSPKKSAPSRPPAPPAPNSNLLIDFSLDAPAALPAPITGSERLANPFHVPGSPAVNETRITLRTEEEQQAAAREREEKEREQLEKDIKLRRDARRKSLANRRVSFAPEATLHTWDVVLEYQDSTTSSAATNSTRRASSASQGDPGTPQARAPELTSSDPAELPSTPPEQIEEDTTVGSPAHQRDLHQKKRRRSSGIPPMNFNNPDEAISSSPYSGSSSADGSEVDEVVEEDDESESNSDSDDGDGTAMSLDGGNTTDMSMASVQSSSSTGSSARLDEALKVAARQAGTQDLKFDEQGDANMAEDEEIVASFTPWSKKGIAANLESVEDQENRNPFSPAFKAEVSDAANQSDGDDMTMDMTSAVGGILADQQDDEVSMDVTRAFGGIISNEATNRPKPTGGRKSLTADRRQSNRRRSSGGSESLGDETMDLTMAIGGIQAPQDEEESNDEEDMTMEFTSVIGGVLPAGRAAAAKSRRQSSVVAQNRRARESLDSATADETMDMTVAMGRIMPSVGEVNDEPADATIGMDITTALGGILPPQPSPGNRAEAKRLMELETDIGSSPFRSEITSSPPKPMASVLTMAMASETGSPSLAAFKGKGLRRSVEARTSTTPKSKLNSSTPIKKPTTPSKQLTPQPLKPTTPGKTPPSKNVVMRTSSPKRLFKHEIEAASTTPKSARNDKATTPNRLFSKNLGTGTTTPSIVLTPRRRISTGIGLDREGLGSPRIAALLDRRISIGEQACSFQPSTLDQGSRGVRFNSPRAMEEEVDNERQQEEDRENGRKILEREADNTQENDTTLNLKELIQSMTPKKKSLKGRKSLHVGAAKGILGKRPAELDDEDDDEDDFKRLKDSQGSPVKNIRLPFPPSKAETTNGRLTRAARKSLEDSSTTIITPTTSTSPVKNASLSTPHGQSRFKDAEANTSLVKIPPPAEKEPVDEPQIEETNLPEDRIHLQDFLNMTSIRFMELTTTKRRHTVAPKTDSLTGSTGEEAAPSFEDCVAVGASTVQMLELFQHQCRELKSYISQGRKTFKEIEAETFEENPPLFREYISATPEMKIVMDNQLKNVKTHARLESKGMWYEWRLKLLRTLLNDGLLRIADGMVQDEEIMDQQQALIDTILPDLQERTTKLSVEEADLQQSADELASCDPNDLADARHKLVSLDEEIQLKQKMIADLQTELKEREAEIELGTAKKQACLDEISEAEKIREESRVDKIEEEHGWTITGVSGSTISMTYRKEIELVFDASSFMSHNGSTAQPMSSRIDLWYIAANREPNPLPLTAEREFFLQSIRDHVRGLPQSQTSVKSMLDSVGIAWNKANAVVDDIRLLNTSCLTDISKTSDSSIVIQSSLLIAQLETKVKIAFELLSQSGESGLEVEINPNAYVVYGEKFNEPKIREFLLNRLGNRVTEKGSGDKETWAGAIAELAEKLLARGKK
ncbi:hypothetical protein BP5796_06695 [Coleophoma crateriformis]|uniref:Spc7 kinetochore protein domain-containing protein n=1 Tax=Coleophoma crateriformis TaxID=565419 RepID=A0A3D8RPR8_9HELO|nr:hypothetical protein BP5796_06695 [Coleophoma crateriformis]